MQLMTPLRCVCFSLLQRFLHDISSKGGHNQWEAQSWQSILVAPPAASVVRFSIIHPLLLSIHLLMSKASFWRL